LDAKVSHELWNRFRREVSAAITAAASHPLRYPVYLYGTRRVLLKSFPYLVVFLEWQGAIFIIAVAHGRRDAGYWKSRIPS
jgi:plasmid stabilization system protein ParE